jgi:hypothetical protein
MELQSIASAGSCQRVEPDQVILDRLQEGRRFTVEELFDVIPELSWAQLFMGIDMLSRRGEIQLRRQGFTYTVMKPQTSMVGTRGGDGATNSDH